MRLSELSELLDEAKYHFGDDVDPDVRLAIQPSWPFEYSIDNVIEDPSGEPVIYISEKNQLAYLPSDVSEELGWL
jgi:hypothetical protein